MAAFQAFYASTIGKKVVMAVTGIILTAFVFFHMIGNLKIYFGRDAEGVYYLDHYAEWLKLEMGAPVLMPYWGLWLARIVLLTALVLHVYSGLSLTFTAMGARSKPYAQKKGSPAMFTAQMMRLGGVAIFLFIAYHLVHFTININGNMILPGFVYGEVYQNVITAFQFTPAAIVYMAALVALGLHIFHGGWSMFQTLGLNNRRWKMTWRTLAALVAAAIMVGNISIPIAVMTGMIGQSGVGIVP